MKPLNKVICHMLWSLCMRKTSSLMTKSNHIWLTWSQKLKANCWDWRCTLWLFMHLSYPHWPVPCCNLCLFSHRFPYLISCLCHLPYLLGLHNLWYLVWFYTSTLLAVEPLTSWQGQCESKRWNWHFDWFLIMDEFLSSFLLVW